MIMNRNSEIGLSIIVPVYRTEEYIEQTVKGLLASKYQNIEIILVDDGSPDRCPSICDNLSQMDERVLVFHKENGGVSSARNYGIEKARGKYVAFCDSDDQIPTDAYQKLMECAEKYNADVVRGTVRRVYLDTNDTRLWIRKPNDKLNTQLIGFTGGIYATHLLREHNIYFPKFKMGEDQLFLLQVINHAERIEYIEDVTYDYFVRKSDATVNSATQKSTKEFAYYYDDFLWRVQLLSYLNEVEKLRSQYDSQLSFFCKKIDCEWLTFTKKQRKQCFLELKKIVGNIAWKKQTQNPEGYIQMKKGPFLLMNEFVYTNWLRVYFRLKKKI